MIVLEQITCRKYRVWVFSDIDGEYPLIDVQTFKTRWAAEMATDRMLDLYGGRLVRRLHKHGHNTKRVRMGKVVYHRNERDSITRTTIHHHKREQGTRDVPPTQRKVRASRQRFHATKRAVKQVQR